jgi:dolichol-phosphate mannosyltransferase
MAAVEVSLVIPCYNEKENLRPLLAQAHQALDPLGFAWEMVITDDCSPDGSWEEMQALAREDPRLRVQRLRRQSGETAASWAGMRAARGRVVITLDADLQNDPAEIPRFLEALGSHDVVCGTRVESRGKGDGFLRIASSRIANWVRNKLSSEDISDAGCTYRAFKRECLEGLQLYKGMHRFLPTLFRMQGYTVREIAIRNRPRLHGESKYGVWNRLWKSLYDLLAVRWMKSRWIRIELEPAGGRGGPTPAEVRSAAPGERVN